MLDTSISSPQHRLTARTGRILVSGVQALVRLMVIQARRDSEAGLKTGGFVSGYRGSPLGGLDNAFAAAADLTRDLGIVVMPGVNEEMAATAVAGSQQIDQTPLPKVEGVFSLWYAKGPGLDRASDAIRHGNFQGASARGGVVLAVGDDHTAKSSSIICNSNKAVAGLDLPLFYPSDPSEIVEMGLHAFALSRFSGSWAALKIITDVADSTRTVPVGNEAIQPVLPDIPAPIGGWRGRWPETPLDQERRQIDHRLPAVHAYVRANGLDRIVSKPPLARIGIVSAGKSWHDLQEALRLLGLSEAKLKDAGVALYKMALIWPVEPTRLREFAAGLEDLIVVEEKGAFIEDQIKAAQYGLPGAPRIFGQHGPDGRTAFPATGSLGPEKIAAVLADILGNRTGFKFELEQDHSGKHGLPAPSLVRKPFFCSGCPHNRSTAVPEGSRALAGIGCHGLAAYNRTRTETFAQMGGEGIHWAGLAPFTDERHVFANMGDGTYFHSGLLAIRQAVAANLNITYKLLYNSAVAMTGGQAVDGELSVELLVDQLRAEAVPTIIVVTDDPGKYGPSHPVRFKADRLEGRDRFEKVELELRETPGVSVIVFDQMCATEKRRLRKRGKMAQAKQHVLINDLVCEGCGDCSVKSNCLSVEPVETWLGTKRRINQSTCNQDVSCIEGFCPSFVTIEGGELRGRTSRLPTPDDSAIKAPAGSTSAHQRIVVAGIGGTGVVTIGNLLTTAAAMTGLETAVLDQVGMAQKGGGVLSHIHLARETISALKVPQGQADLVLVADQVVGMTDEVMGTISRTSTKILVNTDVSVTGDFVTNRDKLPDGDEFRRRLGRDATQEGYAAMPFTSLAERLLGNALGANLMMVGYAWQRGWFDLPREGMDHVIDNGFSSGMNRAAFAWGRLLATDSDAVMQQAGLTEPETETLEVMIEKRVEFLAGYQNAGYAEKYRQVILPVVDAERALGLEGLAAVAAKALFRLMSYKDEYEVARLHCDSDWKAKIENTFTGDYKLSYHLAPPLLARRDPVSGHPRKMRLGGWLGFAFPVLAWLKWLRGTPFDPFGWTEERRMERAVAHEYENLLARLVEGLNADKFDQAVSIAAQALDIRGYGHVKAAAVSGYRERIKPMLDQYTT